MTIHKPGQIEETIPCDLKHSSAPVYVHIEATFEVRRRSAFLRIVRIQE